MYCLGRGDRSRITFFVQKRPTNGCFAFKPPEKMGKRRFRGNNAGNDECKVTQSKLVVFQNCRTYFGIQQLESVQ